MCYWCWTFMRKFSRKLIRKFLENDNENGRNFAKINYFRTSFENFAKEILRKFGNPSWLQEIAFSIALGLLTLLFNMTKVIHIPFWSWDRWHWNLLPVGKEGTFVTLFRAVGAEVEPTAMIVLDNHGPNIQTGTRPLPSYFLGDKNMALRCSVALLFFVKSHQNGKSHRKF